MTSPSPVPAKAELKTAIDVSPDEEISVGNVKMSAREAAKRWSVEIVDRHTHLDATSIQADLLSNAYRCGAFAESHWCDVTMVLREYHSRKSSALLAELGRLKGELSSALKAAEGLRAEREAAKEERDKAEKRSADALCFNEGLDEHISDMLDAMRPFVWLLTETSGRIPTEKLSFANWHKLVRVHANVTLCLRTPTLAALAASQSRDASNQKENDHENRD